MTAGGWAAIDSMAHKLHQLADAPRADWQRHIHGIEELRVCYPGSPVPVPLQLMASAVKSVARQMPHLSERSETELRGVSIALANLLRNDMADAVPEREQSHWWVEAER